MTYIVVSSPRLITIRSRLDAFVCLLPFCSRVIFVICFQTNSERKNSINFEEMKQTCPTSAACWSISPVKFFRNIILFVWPFDPNMTIWSWNSSSSSSSSSPSDRCCNVPYCIKTLYVVSKIRKMNCWSTYLTYKIYLELLICLSWNYVSRY